MLVRGKQFKGDMFYPIKTEEDAALESIELSAAAGNPDKLDFTNYCAAKGITDPVEIAGKRGYTEALRATIEEWDAIFKTY